MNQMSGIDTGFRVYLDSRGKDPDQHSPTLRRYHQLLWSKPLPDGRPFRLIGDTPTSYLFHPMDDGELHLTSDGIAHSFRYVRATRHVIEAFPDEDIASFYDLCSTVGGYILFPGRRIDGKATINAARGMHPRIRDRFDLTLECIRRHYAGEDSPLASTLHRYRTFFALFGDFPGYVNHFLLQDMLDEGRAGIRFWLPFDDFATNPMPTTPGRYDVYRTNLAAFVRARNGRIRNAVLAAS